MNEIIYRKADDNDLPQILELLFDRDDKSRLTAGEFMVADEGSRILACGRIKQMEDSSLEMASFAVGPAYQKQGIGGKLARLLIDQEPRRPIYLMCRKTRQGFYEKAGFKEINPKELPATILAEFVPRRDRLAKTGIAGVAMKLD